MLMLLERHVSINSNLNRIQIGKMMKGLTLRPPYASSESLLSTVSSYWRSVGNLAARYMSSYRLEENQGCNILLMGSPGAGKTSIARELSKHLQLEAIDVDDDVLEPAWGMSVADKLLQLGGREFLDVEANTFMNFQPKHSIISMTGSQPLNSDAMTHARTLGRIIYLDVQGEDILNRLAEMKIARIVGQEDGIDMESILKLRQQFYEDNYDWRIICELNESIESITTKVLDAVKQMSDYQGFGSTRSASGGETFVDVTMQGLAPDRGLYVRRDTVPFFTLGQWERLINLRYNECAMRVLEQWIPSTDMCRKDLKALIDATYTKENFGHKDIAPIVKLEKNQYLLELFHGPTGSFKDLALQLTARLFDYASKKCDKSGRSLILVATSGDTGGAVLNAFSRHTETCEVAVLFPEDGVSAIQKAQLTSFQNPRSLVLGVNGDFDFCQTAIKDIFTDSQYEKTLNMDYGYSLSAANSINFARLLPQVVYHAWSYLLMVRDGHIEMGDKVDVCVPTGNFGNILAAYYAKKMGIPFRYLTIASNSNNVVHEFFSTGVYNVTKRSLLTTNSPAIDILKSSNLERYLHMASDDDYCTIQTLFRELEKEGRFNVGRDTELFHSMQADFRTDWCSNQESLDTVKHCFNRTGYLVDPHTAVAKTVADRKLADSDVPLLISATAHYSKFSDGVLQAFGQLESIADNPQVLMSKALQLTDRPRAHMHLWEDATKPRHHKIICKPTQAAVRQRIQAFLSAYAKLPK